MKDDVDYKETIKKLAENCGLSWNFSFDKDGRLSAVEISGPNGDVETEWWSEPSYRPPLHEWIDRIISHAQPSSLYANVAYLIR